jgi:hypothetical protein
VTGWGQPFGAAAGLLAGAPRCATLRAAQKRGGTEVLTPRRGLTSFNPAKAGGRAESWLLIAESYFTGTRRRSSSKKLNKMGQFVFRLRRSVACRLQALSRRGDERLISETRPEGECAPLGKAHTR